MLANIMKNKNELSTKDIEFNLNCKILEVARNAEAKSNFRNDFGENGLENQIRYSLLPYFDKLKQSNNFPDNLINYIKNEKLFSKKKYEWDIKIILDKLSSMNKPDLY